MLRILPQVIRELDRERSALERQEKKLIGDIKKMAKTGQMEAVKIMAKGEVVRCSLIVITYVGIVINCPKLSWTITDFSSGIMSHTDWCI